MCVFIGSVEGGTYQSCWERTVPVTPSVITVVKHEYAVRPEVQHRNHNDICKGTRRTARDESALHVTPAGTDMTFGGSSNELKMLDELRYGSMKKAIP